MTTAEARGIRAALVEARDQVSRGLEDRDTQIVAGASANIPKSELAELSGLSRQGVYDVLAKRAEQEKAASADETAAVEAMWKLGQVVEDRWGLRWRADVQAKGANGWQCRSVGLKVWRTHDKMAERGPLRKVRLDRVLGGDEARTARLAGEAEDAKVTIADADSEEDADQ
jgi:hypothetical protein